MPRCAGCIGWSVALSLISLPSWAEPTAPSPAPSTAPRLKWDASTYCVQAADGRPFRYQIEREGSAIRRILIAPDEDSGGQPLERVNPCDRSGSWERIREAEKHRVPIQPALPEAPPGWVRDEQGRVFQVTFDLMKRFYFGAGWRPTIHSGSKDPSLGRAYLDMGLVASWLDTEARSRHTIHAFEGMMTLSDLETRGQLFTYDWAQSSPRPLVRLTTFFGTPRRYDMTLDSGLGTRILGLHMRPHRVDNLVDFEFVEVHASFYPWQSSDLYSHLKLQAGAAAGQLKQTDVDTSQPYYIAPGGAFSGQFGLDSNGFHYLFADVHGSLPAYYREGTYQSLKRRAGAGAAYEVIFLAINDQPLSLRIQADVDYRNDLPTGVSRLEGTGMVGIRFSAWAPARVAQPLAPPTARNQQHSSRATGDTW